MATTSTLDISVDSLKPESSVEGIDSTEISVSHLDIDLRLVQQQQCSLPYDVDLIYSVVF